MATTCSSSASKWLALLARSISVAFTTSSGASAQTLCDVDGDDRVEIIQQWNNGGRLGTLVYGWQDGALRKIWGSGNMGEGSGAVAWLLGDVNGVSP